MSDTAYNYWRENSQGSVDQYCHNDTSEDNADAHLKRQVMAREVVVAVSAGNLDSVRGSRFSMANSTADAESVYW